MTKPIPIRIWTFRPFSFEAWKATPELLEKQLLLVRVRHDRDERRFLPRLIIIGCFPESCLLSCKVRGRLYYWRFYTMIPIRTGVVRDIRNQINKKITQLPLSFFSEERKGDIIARVSGDVNEIETSIMSSLDMLFKNPILIVIYLVGMIAISWQLTVFVLILLPLAGYVMGQVGKKLKRKSLEGQQQWGFLMSQIEETLGGLRIIKAFKPRRRYKTALSEAMILSAG